MVNLRLRRDPVRAGARRLALGLARPSRTPSDVVEMKEEHHMRLEKLKGEIKVNTRQ
jgi:hypothetical protein